MTRFAQLAIATGALFAAMPAQAADFVISTQTGTSNGKTIVSNDSRYAYDTVNYAVTAADGKSTLNVRATAWTLLTNGTYQAASIASWGTNGLGIYQTNEYGTNTHQIDNANGWEFLVLQFDQAVSLQSAVLTPFALGSNNYTDNDAFIARGTANFGTAMTAAGLKSLADGLKIDTSKQSGDAWFNSNSNDYNNGAKQTYNLSPSKGGNVWVIGGSYFGPDTKNDAFKLNSIAVTSAVPEPTTWTTMILGFGMIGAAARRRRTTGKTQLV